MLFFELGNLSNLEIATGNNETCQLILSLAFQLYDCKLYLRTLFNEHVKPWAAIIIWADGKGPKSNPLGLFFYVFVA